MPQWLSPSSRSHCVDQPLYVHSLSLPANEYQLSFQHVLLSFMKRNPEHPKSVSTVFDESILGPISHQKKSKLAHLKSAEESTSSSKPRDRGKPKTLSTFEKMMLSIEQSRPLATRSTSCELEKGEFEKAPREAGDMVYSGAQHVEWRKFTMEEPFAELPVMKAKEVI